MDENKDKVKGLHASYVFVPTIFITGIIHILIIVCTVLMNVYSAKMTEETKESSECINNISMILSHSSKLSDTITTFIYTPEIPTGPYSAKLNNEPITEYVSEIKIESRDPDKIKENLKKYSIDTDTLGDINLALNNLKYIISEQAHAIRLINSKIPLSDEIMDYIPAYTLTDEELAYSKDEVKQKAREIIFTKEYSWAKRDVAKYINLAQESTIKVFDSEHAVLQFHLNNLRVCLWIMIVTIMIITIIFFGILIKLLVIPIVDFSKKINENERLDCQKSLYEANFLAYSYNELLDRHDKFEDELREVAERDSLTGLPNRYSYNEFLKRDIADGQKACVFMLDINNLKHENDTYGHDRGDELIKKSSQCIRECFCDESYYFRTCGDEFVVIVNDLDKEKINSIIDNFFEIQKKYGVSIAIGYSYSDNVKEVGYERLVIEADKYMYRNKSQEKRDS